MKIFERSFSVLSYTFQNRKNPFCKLWIQVIFEQELQFLTHSRRSCDSDRVLDERIKGDAEFECKIDNDGQIGSKDYCVQAMTC